MDWGISRLFSTCTKMVSPSLASMRGPNDELYGRPQKSSANLGTSHSRLAYLSRIHQALSISIISTKIHTSEDRTKVNFSASIGRPREGERSPHYKGILPLNLSKISARTKRTAYRYVSDHKVRRASKDAGIDLVTRRRRGCVQRCTGRVKLSCAPGI